MKTENKIKIAAAVVTLLLFASLIGVAVLTNANKNLHGSIDAERLKSENLLSERLTLEKQIKNFRNEMKTLEGKNVELDRYLTETQNRLGEKEASIARLTKENAGTKALRKENDEIKKMRNDLYAQLEKLKNSNADLAQQVNQLNSTVASLNKEKKELQAKLETPQQNMIATNFMIEVRKKKEEKLTVRAKKARSIAISFDLPKGSAQSLENFYRVDLLSPTGALIGGKVNGVDVQKANNLTASLKSVPAKNDGDKVNLTFEPQEKLVKGVYSIVIYNGNQYLGSAQIKLVK